MAGPNIPPQNGSKPAFRVVLFSDMARASWGQEWGVPEIVYEFTGGAKKESTDMTQGGIYRRT